jgi:hypothetical protein
MAANFTFISLIAVIALGFKGFIKEIISEKGEKGIDIEHPLITLSIIAMRALTARFARHAGTDSKLVRPQP